MKNLLFLSSKDICYSSTKYFENRISDELTTMGIHVTHIKVPGASDMAYSILKPYFDADYDAVIDINTRIPAMIYNNNYLLDYFNIPVWHYILDHPLYHYEALNACIHNYHIICLDMNHAELIKGSFPHIKSVHVLPVAADCCITYDNHPQILKTKPPVYTSDEIMSDYFKRQDKLIFTGTYTDPVKTSLLYSTKNAIDNHPLFTTLIDKPWLTQEAAVKLLIDNNILSRNTRPVEYLYNNFLVDVFLQAVIREEIITQIIKNHIDIIIYGHGWDAFADKCDILSPDITKYIHIRPEVSYEALPAIYTSAQISINQMPWFKYGIHDRIPLSLMNRCLCLSDTSDYVTDVLNIQSGYGIHTYSLEALDLIPDKILSLSTLIKHKDESVIHELSNGYDYACNNFTWEKWVSSWLRLC